MEQLKVVILALVFIMLVSCHQSTQKSETGQQTDRTETVTNADTHFFNKLNFFSHAEMGIRKAFGGKRRTLLNEVIHENLVLTLLGGIVGWLLSWLFITAISETELVHNMFNGLSRVSNDMSLDFRMFFTPTLFLVAFLCCAVLNLMAALLPAWHSLRKPIVESLNQKR
jgi:hypothetical protein